MKKSISLLVLSLLLLSSCKSTPLPEEPPVEEPVDSPEQYSWDEQGLSFEIPEGLLVSESATALYLSKEDLSNFEGETPQGTLVISIQEGSSVEEAVEPLSQYENYSTEEVTVNGQVFTEVHYRGDMYDSMVTAYAIQKGEDVVFVFEGENEEAAQTILETLEF